MTSEIVPKAHPFDEERWAAAPVTDANGDELEHGAPDEPGQGAEDREGVLREALSRANLKELAEECVEGAYRYVEVPPQLVLDMLAALAARHPLATPDRSRVEGLDEAYRAMTDEDPHTALEPRFIERLMARAALTPDRSRVEGLLAQPGPRETGLREAVLTAVRDITPAMTGDVLYRALVLDAIRKTFDAALSDTAETGGTGEKLYALTADTVEGVEAIFAAQDTAETGGEAGR